MAKSVVKSGIFFILRHMNSCSYIHIELTKTTLNTMPQRNNIVKITGGVMGRLLSRLFGKGNGNRRGGFKTVPGKNRYMEKKGEEDLVELRPSPAAFKKSLEKRKLKAESDIKITKTEKVSRDDVANALSYFGRNWDDEIKELLEMPEELFKYSSGAYRYYSSERDSDLASFLRSIMTGRLVLPDCDYGISIYETTGSIYFVMVDLKRRIAVRAEILSYHDEPPERDWGKIKENIKSAIKLSKTEKVRKKGFFAVYDGIPELRKPREEF